jgi:hypothetical protein
MMALLSVLISGVLLNNMDAPMPKYHLAFISADGKLTKTTTDKNGKFRVHLAPGTYRFQWGLFTVDKNISTLTLKERPEIKVIRGTQRFSSWPSVVTDSIKD